MDKTYNFTANVLQENPSSNRLVAHFTSLGAPDTHAIIPQIMPEGTPKFSVGDVITGYCQFSPSGELFVREITDVEEGGYDFIQQANLPELNSVS